MSMVPYFLGQGSDAFDPFPVDGYVDPFESLLPASYYSVSCPTSLSTGRRSAFPFSAVGGEPIPFAHAAARVDWKETPAAHVFQAELPGLRKDEVKVEVEDGRLLHITADRTRERRERTDIWHRVERSSGRFQRMFRLSENAMIDQATAVMENGVLTVTVPKEAAAAGRRNVRSVEISG